MFDRSDIHLRRLRVHAKSGGLCPLQSIFDLALQGLIEVYGPSSLIFFSVD